MLLPKSGLSRPAGLAYVCFFGHQAVCMGPNLSWVDMGELPRTCVLLLPAQLLLMILTSLSRFLSRA